MKVYEPLAIFLYLKNRPQDICPGAGLFIEHNGPLA